MFLHKDNWIVRPMHSLASLLMMTRLGKGIFEEIAGKESKFVNDLFRSLYEELNESTIDHRQRRLTASLTSHSARRGSTSDCHSHPEIQVEWLNDRGGWKMASMMKIFYSLSSSRKNDARVGRIISGWAHASTGGVAPSSHAIPREDDSILQTYCIDLLGTVPVDLSVSLVSVLLLRYQDVKNEFPSSAIIRQMENKSISLDKLNEWSNLMRKDFVTRNATSLPISSEDQDTLIPLVDFQTLIPQGLTILNGNIRVYAKLLRRAFVANRKCCV
jgi:hypothetical protein